ncbi:MAG: hypothetical protein NC299_11305 [Lachnospiraceae bacterium]|nr:hypothetical protein [Ruminococcus sp.]MCM1275932.1 hypothetical protein [Lachnospiraceae bacterium]
MSIKRILAAAAASVVAVSAMATVASAATNLLEEPFDVGTGWDKAAMFSFEQFTDVKVGDVIAVTFTIDTTQDYNLVYVGENSNGWSKLKCSSFAEGGLVEKNQEDGHAVVIGDGTVNYTLTADDVDALQFAGLIVKGYGITVTAVEVGEAGTVTAPTPAPAAADNTATDNNGGSTTASNVDTGVGSVAMVVGAAALAAGAMIVAKKRK